MKKLFFILSLILLLASCSPFRFHNFGETPVKPGKYPHFTSKDYLAGYLDEDRAGYDVTSYDLNLVLEPDRKKLKGEVVIHFRTLKKLKQLRFDLYNNLVINSIKYRGGELSFRRSDRAVYASFPDTLDIGKAESLIVSYEGRPLKAKKPPWRGGVVWEKDKDGNPWIGVTCENEGASIWFPCKDHLSDEPDSVRLKIKVPYGLQVVSNGRMESHISEPGNETYTWSTNYPVNIYNITFYAGKYAHFSDTMNTGNGILNLDYYVLPANLEKAKVHFRQVKDVIRIFSRAFGPYPWIKEGYKLIEGPFEGMEHQTAIAYGSGFSDLPWLGGDYIIVHETAHEWWGNAVSVSDFSDIWLQEGFATYSEMVFTEYIKGYENSLIYAEVWLAGMINNKRPLVGPSDVSYWDYEDVDVYNKGALILHTIRNIINDSTLFFDILQTFYREHAALSHVTTADFKELVERKTGKDWDIFFEAYLYRREVPVLHWYFGYYEIGPDEGGSQKSKVPFVVAKWSNVPDGFVMPVTLDGNNCAGSVTIEVTTRPEIYYLKGIPQCSQLICNKKRSYFDVSSDDTILKEFESAETGKE
jgi:aminopeptidase N